MKLRTSFVSNSSSASFIIPKRYVSPEQIELIKAYIDGDRNDDGWNITENDQYLRGFTIMDNNAISDFFREIDVDICFIHGDS
jgi:hypothetical protein